MTFAPAVSPDRGSPGSPAGLDEIGDWDGDWSGAGAVPAAVRSELSSAVAAWDDESVALAHIRAALSAAPDHPEVRVGAYKFYFYKHHYAEAAPLALWCVQWAMGRLGLGSDWRRVSAGDAAFGGLDWLPRFFLFALKAYGYVLVRTGALEAGRAAVARAAELDPADRIGAGRLLAVIDRMGIEPDDDA